MKESTVKALCRNWENLDTHDNITLSQWGPYSKRFFGVSHIAQKDHGARFDLFGVPSIYRRNPFLPEARAPFNYLPWEASSDLSYYSYRQQLLWKDRIYMQGSFLRLPAKDSFLCQYSLVNKELSDLEFSLHIFSLLAVNPNEKCHLLPNENSQWLDVQDYSNLSMTQQTFYEGQNTDGYRPGLTANKDAVHSVVLGLGFGSNTGDKVQWHLPEKVDDKAIFIRCAFTGKLELCINNKVITLESVSEGFALYSAGTFSGKEIHLSFAKSLPEGKDFLLDGIAIGEEPSFVQEEFCQIPEVWEGTLPNSLILKFPASDFYYILHFDRVCSLKRIMAVEDLVEHFKIFNNIACDPTSQYYNMIRGGDAGYNICLQPLSVKAGGKLDIYLGISKADSFEEAKKISSCTLLSSVKNCQKLFTKARKSLPEFPRTPYDFSQKRMQAVTMTNIVYPIRLGKEYIRHFTPGRFWDCLYTWDSGFTGLGLLEIDPARAAECLNTYTYPEKCKEASFVRHGTPLATQILLFHELLNRTCSKEFLQYFYPRVKKMHDFLSGLDPRSNTAKFAKNGVLRSWKYGYNSGGWDDYPAQQYVHRQNAHHILPVITNAFCARTAKILAGWAEELGKEDDSSLYRQQAEELLSALQKYAWNSQSGYFSYMRYDEKGNYQGHFLMEDGIDWNMGLDGISPLIAGGVTSEQHKLLWKKLRSKKHFRSPTGISTVDMRAPYFKNDGYANGVNWTAFEYFLWKTALDNAQFTDAWNIAYPALELWQKECETFYGCFEHFVIRSCRGNGWPHFSSFSTPYSCYFHAFYTPGRVTSGFDTQILANAMTAKGGNITIKNNHKSAGKFGLLLSLDKGEYSFFFNGKKLKGSKRMETLWELPLPKGSKGILKVEKQ